MGLQPLEWTDSTLELKRQRLRYWELLRRARDECKKTGADSYYEYVLDQSGIEVILDHSGNITGRVRIVDEQKYIMFLLRHGH